MTITPTAAAPAVLPGTEPGATTGAATGGPVGGNAAGAAVPGDFLALVQQALTAALGGTPARAATAATKAAAGNAGGAKAAAEPDAGATAADTALAAAANGLVAVVAPALSAPAAPPAGPAGQAVGQVVGTAAGSTAGAVTATGGASTGVTATRPQLAAVPAGAHTAEGKGQDPAVDGDAAAMPVAAPTAGPAHPTGAESGTSADPGAGQQAPAPALSVVATAAPGAPAAPTATAAPAPAAPVSGQVFPEVTSLVSRGDGTHRITLTLKPEALGEVRVVMTVRDGSVHVRLAAGHDAQQALLAGSQELLRLLEHAGASDTRIVVRDLAGATAPTTGSPNDRGADLGQPSGFGPGAGDNRSQDQHAGTRAEHHATDGGHDTTTAGTSSSRTVQPATRTRSAGVDVSM